jgi:hypothetical protein
MIVELGADGPWIGYQVPGGLDHDRESPYYDSLSERYLSNTPTSVAFTPEAARASAVEIVTLAP